MRSEKKYVKEMQKLRREISQIAAEIGQIKSNDKLTLDKEETADGCLKKPKEEIRTWGFWRSLRPLLHHTSSAHNSHSAPELISLSNRIKPWGKLVLVQYDANIWC